MPDPYRTVVVDPPWPERGGGRSKRGADRHYDVASPKEICDVILSARWLEWQGGGRVYQPAHSQSHLWLWVTDNYLTHGLWLMHALGYRYVRTFVWVKGVDAELDADVKLQIGLGQYARGSHELCLFGVRGVTCLPDTDKRPPSVLVDKRNLHSQKPERCYSEWFEAVSRPPRLEMFARATRPGWDSWGNEVDA